MFIQNKSFNLVQVSLDEIIKRLKNKFVIALDFDGVITSPYQLKTDYINELGYDIKITECSREVAMDGKGVSKEDYDRASIRAYTELPDKLPLEKDFLKNFNKLRKLKDIEIFILTSRDDSMMGHVQEYLKHYKIMVDGIIHTQNKEKAESLIKINARMFVEDSRAKLARVIVADLKFSKKCKMIFYRNVHNAEESAPGKGTLEAYNWEGLFNLIEKEYKKSFNYANLKS